MSEKPFAERFSKAQVFAALFLVGGLISYWRWANQQDAEPPPVDDTRAESVPEAALPDGAVLVQVKGPYAYVEGARLDQAGFTDLVTKRRKTDPRLEVVVEGYRADPALVDEFADLARMAGVTRVSTR